MEKYGFVYIWFDRKHKRYYIGCHWGSEDDGYICSSNWMRRSYERRRLDFRRKILSRTNSREELYEEEYRWLSMIKDEELKVRYYNMQKKYYKHWFFKENNEEIKQKLSKSTKGSSWWMKDGICARSEDCPGDGWIKGRPEELKEKTSNSTKGKFWWTKDDKCITSKDCPGDGWIKGRKGFSVYDTGYKNSEETNLKISISRKKLFENGEIKTKRDITGRFKKGE